MSLNEISPLLFFSVNGVLGTVFLLGMRHGFDADHLAAIDSLTRVNSDSHPTLAKWVGTLFSLGHGAIVCVAALCVSVWFGSWLVPAWMEQVGSWMSIGILLILAAINFLLVFRSQPSALIRPCWLAQCRIRPTIFPRTRIDRGCRWCLICAVLRHAELCCAIWIVRVAFAHIVGSTFAWSDICCGNVGD